MDRRRLTDQSDMDNMGPRIDTPFFVFGCILVIFCIGLIALYWP